MTQRFRYLASVPALAIALAAASVGHARPRSPTAALRAPATDTTEEARAHFERGVELFEDGDFRRAVFEFDTAYEFSGNAHLLYNIAVCRDELHQYAAAATAYRTYLDKLAVGLPADRVQQVESELEKLRLRVGTLVVESVPPGANVRANGESLGTTPVEVPFDLGEVRLELSLDGYEADLQDIRVVGAERTEVAVTLHQTNRVPPPGAAVGAGASGNSDTVPTAKRVRALRTGALVSVGLAGTAGIGAAVVGSLAVGANSDLEDERGRETTRGELDDLADRRSTLAVTTDVLLIVTGVAAVTALGLGVAHLRAKKKRGAGETAVRATPGGLSVRF